MAVRHAVGAVNDMAGILACWPLPGCLLHSQGGCFENQACTTQVATCLALCDLEEPQAAAVSFWIGFICQIGPESGGAGGECENRIEVGATYPLDRGDTLPPVYPDPNETRMVRTADASSG